MKTLLKNARILKMDDSPLFFGDIIIENNKILYIGSDSSKYGPFDLTRDIQGNVLMPGFKNAHTHSSMTFLRSRTDDANLQHWLFDIVFPREALLRPGDYGPLAKVSFLEYLTSGITACLDQYFYPLETSEAAKEIGIRFVNQTIFPDENPKETIINTYKELNKDKDSLVSCVIGMHAEYTANDDKFKVLQEVIKELLIIVDNFERAIKLDDTNLTDELSKFLEGFKMIYTNLVNILNSRNVHEIICLNEEFDPNKMNAVLTEKVEGIEPGKVVEVLQKGYVYNDKVIRPAMVKVSE